MKKIYRILYSIQENRKDIKVDLLKKIYKIHKTKFLKK